MFFVTLHFWTLPDFRCGSSLNSLGLHDLYIAKCGVCVCVIELRLALWTGHRCPLSCSTWRSTHSTVYTGHSQCVLLTHTHTFITLYYPLVKSSNGKQQIDSEQRKMAADCLQVRRQRIEGQMNHQAKLMRQRVPALLSESCAKI